jgi:hypothetical protein
VTQRALRFGIHDGAGRRATTWKLWTETAGGKSDVYLTCRSLGGALKTSFHQSGKWHTAFSQSTFENSVKGAIPKFEDRYIEKWPRPPEFASGATDAFRIVIPWSAVTSPIEGSNTKGVTWIPNAPDDKATEISIQIIKPTMPVSGWPGKRSMGTSLIGSIPLENGEKVWVVYWVVDIPDLTNLIGTGQLFKGRKKEDMDKKGLRALVFGKHPDGALVIVDCAGQSKI